MKNPLKINLFTSSNKKLIFVLVSISNSLYLDISTQEFKWTSVI
jgi:hypothetical protein